MDIPGPRTAQIINSHEKVGRVHVTDAHVVHSRGKYESINLQLQFLANSCLMVYARFRVYIAGFRVSIKKLAGNCWPTMSSVTLPLYEGCYSTLI